MVADWWWILSLALGVAGVWLMLAAQWSGNALVLPDGRFFAGLALLLLDVGYTLGMLIA